MTTSRSRLLAGLGAAPIVAVAVRTAWRLARTAALVRRSEAFQVAPPQPTKRLLIVGDSTGVGTGASTPQTTSPG